MHLRVMDTVTLPGHAAKNNERRDILSDGGSDGGGDFPVIIGPGIANGEISTAAIWQL